MKKLFTVCILLIVFTANASAQWNLTGNANTIDGTNFIGTTNNVAFSIRVNNQKSGRIDPALGNSFYGYLSGMGNTTGYYNTANGTGSLNHNTWGYNNTALGNAALFSNIDGISNTATGNQALFSNISGNYNTATGSQALFKNNYGYQNTATGYFALYNNTVGYNNTALGYSALSSNSAGYNNTAIGLSALSSNTSGIGNTGIGITTLTFNQLGSYNTAIGYNAGANSGQNPSNFTALGYYAGHIGGNDNTVEVGNSSVIYIGGQVGWSVFSDKRIKDNIKENVPGLSFIKELRPVTYNLNIHRQNEITGISKTGERDWEGKYDIEKTTMTGFLAQDVATAADRIGYDFSGVTKPKNNTDLYSLRYSDFVVPIVKSIQEQQQMIEQQAKEIEELKILVKQLIEKNKTQPCNTVVKQVETINN